MVDEKAIDNYECEGQMNISDYFLDESESALIAVSKIFARAIKQMNLSEWKAFVYALTKIKFKEKNGNIVYLDKKKTAEIVGIHSDYNHMSQDLKRSIGDLPKHSFLEIEDKDKDFYESGVFVTRLTMYKNRIKIKFEEDYMPLFESLNDASEGYITMWADDLFKMTSDRSILFYEDLRLHSDTRVLNEKVYSTKELKELFNIPKDGKGSYIQADGRFNRSNFEKRVLDPLCDDLKKSRMIDLSLNQDGKYYKKEKRGNRVLGYRFCWTIAAYPKSISAKEVHELNQDPVTLKKAKNIQSGKRRKAAEGTENREERKRYYEDLENKLL